ncbi:Zinc import ATP-binding protein ZnuC [wastewater metagenome]|uniref:Zinc import ATP-binding protein ZnuC n=3 Tax=root TaxID=1 RepID=A0A5B8RCN5_9ZZZZ|nr:zinc import ATP-binding protein ZnuC [uncultured organism]
MPLLSIEHCDIWLGGHIVLDNITLSLERGEIVAIVGPNGSGKTTLLRAVTGSLAPGRGRIRRSPGTTIGYVPQRLHIDATLPMTVSRFMNLPTRHAPRVVTRALGRTDAAGLEKHQMSGLSGGQLQRVLLARALQDSPGLLLLDEAAQGLDHRGVADFYRQLKPIRRELGCGILMVSHELHAVMRVSDRVICLNRSVCCEGPPEQVAASPTYQAMFGYDIDDDAPPRHQRHHTDRTLERTG